MAHPLHLESGRVQQWDTIALWGFEMDASSDVGDRTPPQEILHPASRWLFRYWETIRGEKSYALRDDIKLTAIRQQLPWIFIAERGLSGAHVLRLAGTGICSLWGGNMTGKCLSDSWSRFESQTMSGLMEGALKECQPFVMRIRARSACGNVAGLEILGLPVMDQTNGAMQIFGLAIPFRMPDWLGRDRLTTFELSSVRIIWTDHVPQRPVPLHPHNRRRSKTSPSLTLINGGRLN